MPLQSIQYGPWTGGVRYDIPPEDCAANELSGMQNVHLGTAAEARMRLGTDSYQDAATIGSTTVLTMVAEFKPDASTTHVVVVAGTAIYKYSSGWTAITGGVTVTAGADNTFEWVNANGTLVATNGVDTDAWKWTGTGNATVLDDDARFTKGKHIAWFDNRLWIGNVNGATGQLWYSNTADIETWGATSFYNFGGRINALVPTQNALVVHTTDGIYTLIPTSNSALPYHPQKRTVDAAIDGRSVVALSDDLQLMVREDGIYEWAGGSELRRVSLALDGDAGYWTNLNTSRLTQAWAVRVPQSYVVAFGLPYGASETEMNHIMYYDYRRRTVINGQDVGIWYGPDTGNERNCAAIISNKLHCGGHDGILYDHEDTGYSNDGGSVVAWFETGAPAPIGSDVTVAWVYSRHYYDATGDYSLTVLQAGAELVGETSSLSLSGTTLTLPDAIPGYISDQSQFPADLPLLGYSPQSYLRYSMNSAGQSFIVRRCQLWFDAPARTTKPDPVTTT